MNATELNMDYEKEYKEMVKRVKEFYDVGNALTKKQMEIICPELAESEDERIRKSVIGFLKTIASLKDGKTVSNEDFDSKALLEWASYLEKQEEHLRDATKKIPEDLEKVVDEQMEYDGDVDHFVRKGIDEIALKYAAIGAKWQREQMRLQAEKALAKNFLTIADMVAFDKGVAEGRRLEREEMLNYVQTKVSAYQEEYDDYYAGLRAAYSSMLDKLKENKE